MFVKNTFGGAILVQVTDNILFAETSSSVNCRPRSIKYKCVVFRGLVKIVKIL